MSDDNEMKDLAAVGNAKISTPMGIAALALNMAVRYHDINTVKDGALYQQYKIEGKNMEPLHLDVVFETAVKIEQYLLISERRISSMIAEAVTGAFEDVMNDETAGEAER